MGGWYLTFLCLHSHILANSIKSTPSLQNMDLPLLGERITTLASVVLHSEVDMDG